MLTFSTTRILMLGFAAQTAMLAPPDFVEARALEIKGPAVAIFTHCSSHFDPLFQTRDGVNRLARTMREQGVDRLYFHDKYNQRNPYWKYHYTDRLPTAYVPSDIGHYDTDSAGVRHVISVGGFFWLCQKNTVLDAVRNWRRDSPDENLRITQVLDGVFDVAEGVRSTDPYAGRVRTYFREELRDRHRSATISVARIIELIGDKKLAIEFLKRQLPSLPPGFDVDIDYFGHIEPWREGPDDGSTRPTLTLAYRLSTQPILSRPSAQKTRRLAPSIRSRQQNTDDEPTPVRPPYQVTR